ncbi:hypothetical protein [Kitasatospora sp. NPDC093679]|uniref:hypothetical protein n=1 Tax=Kitasatospora sp. NPDC093679 TaxID=3154983 RepID=UPI00341638F9
MAARLNVFNIGGSALSATGAVEADRRLEELAAVARFEARAEQVLDLLARTAAGDFAAAGTRILAE